MSAPLSLDRRIMRAADPLKTMNSPSVEQTPEQPLMRGVGSSDSSAIRRLTSKWKTPVPCWAWCDDGGYDNGWWRVNKRLDLFTIGSLTHWHPYQPFAPAYEPKDEGWVLPNIAGQGTAYGCPCSGLVSTLFNPQKQ